MPTSDDFALKDYIQRTASHLIAAMEAAPVDVNADVHFSQVMVTDVIELIIHFAKIDRDFSLDEVELLANIIDWIDPNYRNEHLSSWTSPEQLRWVFLNLDKETLKWTGGDSINILSRIDDTTGSVFAEEAKAMYFRIANAIVKVDGHVAPQELEAIAGLKESLYPPTESAGLPTLETEEDASTQSGVITHAELRGLGESVQELNSLVGLETVKHKVKELANFVKDQQSRKAKGHPTLPIPRRLAFFGNAGTGKTTVARVLAEIYGSLRIIEQGHLVKADRSHLVAGFVGQTAPKVRQVTESALGGVLFISEAHSLVKLGQDYELEAIDTLLKFMEYYRQDLIIILAGNPEKMKSFIGSNPSLRSQFNTYFFFEDYSPKELLDIFCLFCKNAGYRSSRQAIEQLQHLFDTLYDTRGEDFGNAHLAKNIFEKTINNQANRLISMSDVSEEHLSAIYSADIPGHAEFQRP